LSSVLPSVAGALFWWVFVEAGKRQNAGFSGGGFEIVFFVHLIQNVSQAG
jgi:hypothetical protein